MVDTLQDRYRHASLHVQNLNQAKNDAKMEQNRWKLYGWHKQVMEGDCTTSLSSTESNSLKSKWNAWNACKGMSREEAMRAFIGGVKEIDPTYEYEKNKTSAVPTGDMTDKLLQESHETKPGDKSFRKGYLRKKSDWRKNWDERFFVLRGGNLRYFLKQGDVDPRMTLRVKDCEVMKRTDSVMIDGKLHYGLTVNHQRSSTAWALMSSTKEDRDDWVAALEEVRGTSSANVLLEKNTIDSRSSKRRTDSTDGASSKGGGKAAGPLADVNGIVYDSCTANIPASLVPRLEKNVAELLKAAEDRDGWETLFSKDIGGGRSMHAYRKPGDTIMVKGSAVIPFSMKDVFSVVSTIKNLGDINPQVDQTEKLKVFSATTSTNHIVFKQVWPTAVRDMINFTHWRIVSGNKIVIVTYNAENLHEAGSLEPHLPPRGAVRANLMLGGYVLVPDLKKGTTEVTYVVSSDLRGNIPTSVSNHVARGQPLIVSAIYKHLQLKDPSELLSSPMEMPTYDDLCQVVLSHGGEPAKFGIYRALKGGEKTKRDSSGKDNAEDPGDEDWDEDEGSRSLSLQPRLFTLMLPLLLAYVMVDYRFLGFVVGLCITIPYLHKEMLLGSPQQEKYPTNVEFGNALPRGRVLVQFSVDLEKLLRYVDGKRDEYGMDITLTHVVAKAAASALDLCPDLNGRIVGNTFYRNKGRGVAVSVSAEYSDMIAVKIKNAQSKTLNVIADELQMQSRTVRRAIGTEQSGSKGSAGGPATRAGIILDAFPSFVSYSVRFVLRLCASYYGMSFPGLGILPYPHGACNIVATPRDSSRKEELQLDVGVVMVPETDFTLSSPPVVVTIGGLSLKTFVEIENGDKKVSATPVLNLAVSVDSRAAGFARGRQFARIFEEFMTEL